MTVAKPSGGPSRILPDPYWTGMIVGRLVHLHVTLVERQLFLAHRQVEDALLAGDRVAVQAVSRLDGVVPADRVLARLWLSVLGDPLPETIAMPDRFVAHELPGSDGRASLRLLVFSEHDDLATGLTQAWREIEDLGLDQIVRLGIGLAGTTAMPKRFDEACTLESILLPVDAWRQEPEWLAEAVLGAAARSLAGLWAAAEVRAYRLDSVPSTAEGLANDFAVGAVAELRRRRFELSPTVPHPREGNSDESAVPPGPAQEPVLPLLSELVRCWWPAAGRAQHIFGSPFDYVSTLEADRVRH